MTSPLRKPLDFASLPEDPRARREALERRAEPSETKPPVDPELEAQLSEIEERSAQCYINAEETTYRFRRAAERIKGWVPRYSLLTDK